MKRSSKAVELPTRTTKTAEPENGRKTTRFTTGGAPGPGRPKGSGERALLRRMYGEDGAKVFERLERLRQAKGTPAKLQAEIDFFIIERLFGRAQQQVDVGATGSLAELIARAVGGSDAE